MKKEKDNIPENIKILFKYMEWNRLTDRELNLLESFEDQFKTKNWLSDQQFEILNEIFDRANAR